MASASPLRRRAILIVEDEPLIALDLATELRACGALTFTANSVRAARRLLARHGFSIAVLDYRLGNESADTLRDQLNKLGIPFVVYSGYEEAARAWPEAVIVHKPAAMQHLIETIGELLPPGERAR